MELADDAVRAHQAVDISMTESSLMLSVFWLSRSLGSSEGDLIRAEYLMRMRIEIQARIQLKTLDTWLGIFSKMHVCVELVLSLDQVIRLPQFQARQMFVGLPAGYGTQQKQLASPLRFSSFQPIYRFVCVAKGADNSLLK